MPSTITRTAASPRDILTQAKETGANAVLTTCGVVVIDADLGFAEPTALALTPCCGAMVTGSISGVVCKGCYELVEPGWGGPLEGQLAAHGCPCPSDCATHSRWQLELKRN